MPGTATAFSKTVLARGPGNLWANVAVPGANGRMTLHTDGTPESVANPLAKHIGYTKEGAKITYKPTLSDQNADETSAPLLTLITAEEFRIEAAVMQVMDIDIIKLMAIGGTKAVGAGYEQTQFGGLVAPTYFSLAYIWPSEADPTKFCVAQIYSGYCESGLEFTLKRNELTASPFNIKAVAVANRAAGDQMGSLWRQVA